MDKHVYATSPRLLALIATLWAGTAHAIDAEGNYAIWGIGQTSCHQFTKAYATDALSDYRSYVAGYLTAFNAMAKDVYQVTGKHTMKDNLSTLQAHCTSNPIDSFERAIQALIETESARARDTNAGAAWGRAAPAQ